MEADALLFPRTFDRDRAHASTYRALNYTFRIETDLPGAHGVIERIFSPWRVAAGRSSVPTYRLTRGGDHEKAYAHFLDGALVNRGDAAGPMLDWIIVDVTRSAIDSAAALAIHAGVVASDDRAVVLVGPPDVGKTTLTAALTINGWRFLSDEVAPLDLVEDIVHPFPRPILMDASSMHLLGIDPRSDVPDYLRTDRLRLLPSDLGGESAEGSVQLACLIAPRYVEGARTELLPMAKADCLRLLLRQCFNLDRYRGTAVRRLAALLTRTPCYQLLMGDPWDAVAAVSTSLGSMAQRSQ